MRLEYFLKTQRIGFRIWKEEDLHLAIGLWGDVKVTQFIDARGQLSTAQITEWLLHEIDTERLHGIQYWPIFLLKNEGSGYLLGKLGFRYTHDEFYTPTGLNHPSYMLTTDDYARLINTRDI